MLWTWGIVGETPGGVLSPQACLRLGSLVEHGLNRMWDSCSGVSLAYVSSFGELANPEYTWGCAGTIC